METTFKRSQYYYLWTGNRRFIFLLPSFRASCKMLRSPRLAHKAPQLCRLTCPWLKFLVFLFCFVCLFVCLFVFLESLNPLALSKHRVETVRKKE